MKNYHYIIAIVILLGILIFGAQYIMESDNRIQGLESALEERESQITYRKTQEGKLIADKLAAEMRAREFEDAYPKLAEDISRQFDVKLKNLRAVIHAEFEARGSGNSVVNNYYDSTGRQALEIQADDGYLQFKAQVYDSLDAPYEYTYRDSIRYVFHVKKQGFLGLGKRSLYASGMLSNPSAKITNSTSVLVREAGDKRWGIGPYVGYGFGADGPQTTFGISVHYSLIKF
jgi:hypothetical protein